MSPVEWSPCRPRTIQLPLTASPCGRLSRPPSTISQYDLHSVVRPSSPWRLIGPYKLAFEPDGSPLFTLLPLVACWRYEPREHLRLLALRGLWFRLPPYGIGSATPITIDFGAIFPFTSFRPTTSLSTLRSGRYRTPRKTRFAARAALAGTVEGWHVEYGSRALHWLERRGRHE